MIPVTRVQQLTNEDLVRLEAGLQSDSAFTVRRCQILLLSAREGATPQEIARRVGCSDQTVRNTIRAFAREGMTALTEKTHRPLTVHSAFSQPNLHILAQIIRQSPREYGYDTNVWSLERLAEVSYQMGLTPEKFSYEAIRKALKRLGLSWRQARKYISVRDSN
jgi:transposase